ncbi:electron transfer flavoprotein subunit beta/FixA family protein [Lysinibacillus endophyticus]|uniref:electron transfer flavoprotein subunit beta/FixA family protein n=1 Tax=Ureibacillus endophyticus TaxID=1978490 RepID=UPI00209F7763|nr:electron transfer flavoprotein subunit beta/FixA family protein [Lysinibacillus endophyticus]MCP1146714.1 electron transfer flavoprotein subunit beta/FixA family protein [Lysinibacillus endophyticus]
MKIIVLLKRTFDTEEKITLSNGIIQDSNVEFIINPYDEYAIEEAIQLRDAHGGEVTVVTVGEEEAEKQLRTALAMGADEAVLINVEEDLDDIDQYGTATILAKYLEDKEVDLILAGNVTVDGGTGQIGPRVADLLELNCITTVTKVSIDGENVEVVRDSEGDLETLQTKLPLVLTTQQGLNEPRYPSLPGIMKAKKKPLKEIELDDLDLDGSLRKTNVKNITLPPTKQAGRIFEGEISEQVKELVQTLSTKVNIQQ